MSAKEPELRPDYSKHFIPLESNPEVFTELIHKLGVSDSLSFQDVLSLDDPELLAFLPRPVHALILVFPTTEAYEQKIEREEGKLEQYRGSGEYEQVVFFKQTINNACGLYAILHAVCNGDARTKIANDSLISKLVQHESPLAVTEQALALEGSKDLEHVYAGVAKKGDTEAPDDPEDEVDFHYIAFVKSHKDSHLYQLDGDRKGPIKLGALAAEDDILAKPCLDVIRQMITNEDGNLNFSLMALVEE